jgi:F0F1-type ATP synthase delta subunit
MYAWLKPVVHSFYDSLTRDCNPKEIDSRIEESLQFLELFAHKWTEKPNWRAWCLSAETTSSTKHNFLLNMVRKMKLHAAVEALLMSLQRLGQLKVLSAFCRILREHWAEKAGWTPVVVRSAQTLTPVQSKKLTTLLTQNLGRPVRLVNKIDPSILGGLVVETKAMQWDHSLQQHLKHMLHNTLKNVREQLAKGKLR